MNSFINDLVEELPDISKIAFKSINKNYLKVILLNTVLTFGVLFVGLFLLITFVLAEEIPEYTSYLYIPLIIVFLLFATFFIIGFSKRKYAVRDKDISYKRGIIFKSITTVPFARIQHIEINESPFSRLFNLASISIYTAGDSSDDLGIKGITKKEALEIKEFISQKINE